jgi:hypothetical protein
MRDLVKLDGAPPTERTLTGSLGGTKFSASEWAQAFKPQTFTPPLLFLFLTRSPTNIENERRLAWWNPDSIEKTTVLIDNEEELENISTGDSIAEVMFVWTWHSFRGTLSLLLCPATTGRLVFHLILTSGYRKGNRARIHNDRSGRKKLSNLPNRTWIWKRLMSGWKNSEAGRRWLTLNPSPPR